MLEAIMGTENQTTSLENNWATDKRWQGITREIQ
jgi:hypothetical protein